ncbi:hypothetical protein [Geothrix mesophila]|uniref:hypothetical protein n=1 Tax=Geothrix mesophila TaxID=2922723 RepID=UPI001FAD77D8|nr:hypothetical protein [Geothrix sp. SG198]
MNGPDISKGLEVWSLQGLIDLSILMGLLASGLILARDYFHAVEQRFGLRLSQEAFRGAVALAPDLLLSGTVLIGYLVLNPDVLADVKVAVPFYPVATLLFAAALILRVFKGGHDAATSAFRQAMRLIFVGNLLNVLGFTFIMESASEEYLHHHPSAFWGFLKTHLRSNADPAGLELAQLTFYVCFPILLLLGAWAVRAGLGTIGKPPADSSSSSSVGL